MAARGTQRQITSKLPANGSTPSDFAKVVQVWCAPSQLPRVMGALYEHMNTNDQPHISEFTVADDRGGSGHFWIRIGAEQVSPAQLRKIVGGGVDITTEDA